MITGRSDGKVIIDLDLNDDGFDQNLKNAEKNTSSFAGNVSKIIGAIGLAKLTADFAKMGFDYNVAIEQYQTSFEVMLGSATKASDLMETLKKKAADTPFELSDLASTTQLLLNYGIAEEQVTAKMSMMGDIAQGNTDKLKSVATAYGQMSSANKVSLEDIKQMIEGGFNPLQEIAQTTGVTMGELYDRISKGTMTVDEITASMERSTSEGGKYYQSMEKQSKTLGGQISTLKDNFSQLAGEGMKSVTDFATSTFLPAINNIIGDEKKVDKITGDIRLSLIGLTTAFVVFKSKSVLTTLTTQIGKANALFSTFTSTVKKSDAASGITKLKDGFTGVKNEVSNTSSKTSLFSSVLSNLPLLLVAAGVGLFVAELNRLSEIEKNSPINKLNDSIDANIKKINERAEASEKVVSDGESEFNYYAQLKSELDGLVDANGNVKQGYEDRASFILNELNTAYGTEMQMNGTMIENYQEVGKSLDDLMAKKKASLMIEAYSDDYEEAIKNKNQYNSDFAKVNDLYVEALKYFNKQKKKYMDEGLNEKDANHYADIDLNNKHDVWITDLTETRKKALKAMVENELDINKQEQAVTELKRGNYAEVEKILGTHNINIAKLDGAKKKDIQAGIEEARELEQASLQMYKETGLEKYLSAADQYAADLEQLKTQLAATSGTIEGDIPNYQAAWQKFVESGAAQGLTNVTNMTSVGQTLVRSMNEGTVSEIFGANASIQQIADGMILTINGNAWQFDSAGNFISDSFSNAVGSETNKEKAKGKGKEIGEKAKSGSDSVDATPSGNFFSQGFINGATAPDMLTKIFGAGANIATTILGGLRAIGVERSPWKTTTRSGKFAAQGLAIGIKDNSDLAVNAMKDLASDVIDSANIEMKPLSSAINDAFNLAENSSIVAAIDGATEMMNPFNNSEFKNLLNSNIPLAMAIGVDTKFNVAKDIGKSIENMRSQMISEANTEMKLNTSAPVQNINNIIYDQRENTLRLSTNDITSLSKANTEALQNSGLTIKVGNREFGRVIKEVK